MEDNLDPQGYDETEKTWSVRTTAHGVVLTINGKSFELGSTGSALAFELARAANGWNAPETKHTEGEGVL